MLFSELYSTVISGGEYGVSVYPFTNQLIDLIVDPLSIFSLILIVFYSSEIIWKERSLNFNLILDATPTKNWVFFLSKFSALLLLPIILITSGILMSMLFQVSLNYSNKQTQAQALLVLSYSALYVHLDVSNLTFAMYKVNGMVLYDLHLVPSQFQLETSLDVHR